MFATPDVGLSHDSHQLARITMVGAQLNQYPFVQKAQPNGSTAMRIAAYDSPPNVLVRVDCRPGNCTLDHTISPV